MNNPFSIPQRQAIEAIGIYWVKSIYHFIRAFIAVVVYSALSSKMDKIIDYLGYGAIAILVIFLINSYLQYRNFFFYINEKENEFILKKGVLSKKEIAIEFEKIQQVSFKRNIFQRLLGIYSVVIESVGSKEEEIEILGLKKDKAEALKATLFHLIKTEKRENIEDVSEEIIENTPTEPDWKHELSILDLIKLGLTTNYFRGLALIFVFFSFVYDSVSNFVEEINYQEKFREVAGSFGDVTSLIIFFGIIFLILFFVSILVTVAEIVIKNFNLKLTKNSKHLELEKGLFENTKQTIKPIRVQVLSMVTNPVQRKLNLHHLLLQITSSEENDKKSKIYIPGLPKLKINELAQMFVSQSQDLLAVKIKPNKRWLLKRLLFLCVPIVIFTTVNYFFEIVNWSFLLIIYILYFGLLFYLQIIAYHNLSLHFDEHKLYRKSGIWDKTITFVDLYKVQAITVTQPIWYQKRDLYNVTFHTASGNIGMSLLPRKVIEMVNYNLYKIETSQKKWM
ncbi:PH domain-containing protein [Mesonia sp. K7]|uniref:PH domain-containing protein n=1 Tax=Mesonia sp. K7 TaxID=2218606 RepID=UPI000DA8975A|nr:PH domain-containing protein [Mesonia sp. K7]PZD78256.1 hypothetical protein DNG35_06035 [Mesonia sp. K7]